MFLALFENQKSDKMIKTHHFSVEQFCSIEGVLLEPLKGYFKLLDVESEKFEIMN